MLEKDDVNFIKLLASQINNLNTLIKTVEDYKQVLEGHIKECLRHDYEEAQRTYNVDNLQIKITTGLNYTLDKNSYLNVKESISDKFNPIREITDYKIDKKALRNCMEFADSKDKLLMASFIRCKPKKLNITITENKEDV